jgi:hypothetical protein
MVWLGSILPRERGHIVASDYVKREVSVVWALVVDDFKDFIGLGIIPYLQFSLVLYLFRIIH